MLVRWLWLIKWTANLFIQRLNSTNPSNRGGSLKVRTERVDNAADQQRHFKLLHQKNQIQQRQAKKQEEAVEPSAMIVVANDDKSSVYPQQQAVEGGSIQEPNNNISTDVGSSKVKSGIVENSNLIHRHRISNLIAYVAGKVENESEYYHLLANKTLNNLSSKLTKLLHAESCTRRDYQQCDHQDCPSMKIILIHIASCKQGRKCGCSSLRRTLNHWRNCHLFQCPLCSKVRMMNLSKRRGLAGWYDRDMNWIGHILCVHSSFNKYS